MQTTLFEQENVNIGNPEKLCPHCKKPVKERRKKYCSENCKYRFLMLKRWNERDLPPVRKRTENYFYMITGTKVVGGPGARGQGRRSGKWVLGGMSARIECTTEKIVEVNAVNLYQHFKGIPRHTPTHIKLGTGERLNKEDVEQRYNIKLP